MKKLIFLVAVPWLAGVCNAGATERFVPSGGTLNYPTIQGAVRACVSGDIVRVQPGVYNENIIFPTANILLTSMNPNDSNVVQTTIIQGNSTSSVLTFTNGQSTNTALTGFTIRGGGGTVFPGVGLMGGGMYCYLSSPSIIGNIIEQNNLPQNLTNMYSYGGAISCWFASPIIARNIIRNNSAYVAGAIVSVSGAPVIQDNWFYNNSALAGGVAYLSDHARFLNNSLWDNESDNLYVEKTGLVVNNIIANSSPGAFGILAIADAGVPSWLKYNDIWEPDGTELVLFVQTPSGTVQMPLSASGINGNFSADPMFVDSTNYDLHLGSASPCINMGDLSGLRSTNEVDFDGSARVFALRIDVGASEYHGDRNYPPIAVAGANQMVYWREGTVISLDGGASVDPEGAPLNFQWQQTAGLPVALQTNNSQASFSPPELGEYQFDLVVNDGVYDSTADSIRITVTNFASIACAGIGQSLPLVPEGVRLDGTHSLDPQGQPLSYRWQQLSGPAANLINPESARPEFHPAGAGAYEFELTVSNRFIASLPSRVMYYLGQVTPIASAGPTRYVGANSVLLDGSGSFAPNSSSALEYAWRQISGPPAILTSTNMAKAFVGGFVQNTNVQEMVFELVVSADGLTSAPSTVKVVVVPAWGNTTISIINGPFNTNRPTIIGFGGGNCDTGGAVSFPSGWSSRANLFTCSFSRDTNSLSGDPRYFGYGDQLMVYLSAMGSRYSQPIQTIGFSTGNMPACDVAERFNITYKDARFLVNRITFLDTGCSRDYEANLRNLFAVRPLGKMFWIDNYYSVAGTFHSGILNVEFPVPPAAHGTPNSWYYSSSWNVSQPYRSTNFNNGVFGGAFFSLVGPGKNYQLETAESEYYFGWSPTNSTAFPITNLMQMDSLLYPARLPGAVELSGPNNGTLAAEGQYMFTSQPVLNAVRYQILLGSDSSCVDQVVWEGPTPPTQPLARLPFSRTWWTIRAFDAYGTSTWADPRYVLRDSDADGLSDESEILTYHTDPENADTDGDGHLDSQEVIAGTDPLQPNVGFQLAFQQGEDNQLEFSWYPDPGYSYDLEFTPILTPPSWQTVQTFPAPCAAPIQCTITQSAEPSRFYRVRSYAAGD